MQAPIGDKESVDRADRTPDPAAASIGAEQLAMSCSAMNGLTDSEMGFQQKQLAETIKTEFERAEAALGRYLEDRHRTTG